MSGPLSPKRADQAEHLKKKSMNGSGKLRRNMTSSSRVLSVEIEDVLDAEESQAVDSFRQLLLSEDLLRPKHDDYHMILSCRVTWNMPSTMQILESPEI